MKELILTCGAVVYLDDEDYVSIPKTGWYIVAGGNSKTPYVQHDIYGRLHRYILGITDSKMIVDHIDRNGLNNQKSNLRIVNTSINKKNQNICANNKFNFNGISFEKASGNRAGRIRVSYTSDEYNEKTKRHKTKTKSFSLSKYTLNEALRLAILFRIEKMKELDYLIDERSETIETLCQQKNADMEEILNISFNNIMK